jgi:hypothetical protein
LKNISVLLLLLLFSCAGHKVPEQEKAAGSVFTVTVKNNTWLDMAIIDDSRFIPHKSEKTISLPVYFNELTEGYGIQYHLALSDEVLLRVDGNPRVIKPDQKTALIEQPDFVYTEKGFIILDNDSSQTIRLKKAGQYQNNIAQGWPVFTYGSNLQLGPRKQNSYDIETGHNDLSVETDQYQEHRFPRTEFEAGWVYRFSFDGAQVRLTDERPLRRVGEPTWSRTISNGNFPLAMAGGETGTVSVLRICPKITHTSMIFFEV